MWLTERLLDVQASFAALQLAVLGIRCVFTRNLETGRHAKHIKHSTPAPQSLATCQVSIVLIQPPTSTRVHPLLPLLRA